MLHLSKRSRSLYRFSDWVFYWTCSVLSESRTDCSYV